MRTWLGVVQSSNIESQSFITWLGDELLHFQGLFSLLAPGIVSFALQFIRVARPAQASQSVHTSRGRKGLVFARDIAPYQNNNNNNNNNLLCGWLVGW